MDEMGRHVEFPEDDNINNDAINYRHAKSPYLSYKNKRSKQSCGNYIDVLVRAVIVVVFIVLESTTAFKRKIHMEELWLYQNPRTPDYVSPMALLLSVIFGPFLTTIVIFCLTQDRRDFHAANWAWTLALCFTGLPTSILKITVGRPRPDFYFRCFPDGVMLLHNVTNSHVTPISDMFNCTGELKVVNEGYKSFPSGHASFAFAGFGFIAFYVGTKLNAFNGKYRGQTWRPCVALFPFVLATLIAISRTCDYHHHWQDVTIGAVIGLVALYYSYRQYYPSIFAFNAHRPLRLSHNVEYCYDKCYSREEIQIDGKGNMVTDEAVFVKDIPDEQLLLIDSNT